MYYGYHILWASFVIQGVMIGGMFAFGVLFAELIAEFGWTRASIAGAASVGTIVMGALAIVAGRLNDRVGPRGILSGAALAYGIGFMALAALESPWQLYLFWGLLVGAGLSTHDVVTLSTVARWFPERRGIMSGVVKVGTGFGQLLLPLAAAALIAALGWRHACLAIGAGALVALLVSAQFMRRDPESMGLSAPRAAPGGAHAGAAPGSTTLPAHAFGEAARTPQLWLLCGTQFVVFSCLVTVTVHVVPHAIDLGAPRTTAAGVLATIGAVSTIGRLAIGGSIDRIGGRRGLMACFTILLASLAWLQFAAAPWMLYAFAAVYGIAHGGFFTVMSPTVAELFGLRAHGALFGTVLFFGSLGGAIGPLAAGALFDTAGSYRMPFALLLALAVLGLYLVSRLPARARGNAQPG